MPDESAGGIVLNTEGKLAIIEQHGNSWGLPKGHVEPGESLLEAARREVAEETGITDLAYVCDLGSFERKSIGPDGRSETDAYGVRRRTFFLFTTAQTDLAPQDDQYHEITSARWASLDEALELLTHPKDKEFLAGVRKTIEAAIR